jgi:hypothetical protein
MDAWTISNTAQFPTSQRVKQLGLNFGAPGDRRDQHGLMWLAFPHVVEEAADFGVTIEGDAGFFQDHATTKREASIPWVAASGVEGLSKVTFHLKPTPKGAKTDDAKGKKKPKDDDCGAGDSEAGAQPPPDASDPYRVRLHFGLPRQSAGEARSFSIRLNGNLIAEAISLGGSQPAAATFTIERALLHDEVTLEFGAKQGSPVLSGIELHRLEN